MKMRVILDTLVAFLMVCLPLMTDGKRYYKLDEKTQSEVMKLGKRIFGQHGSLFGQPSPLATAKTTKSFKESKRDRKEEDPSIKMPNPSETWAIWQKNVRQNTLMQQRKENDEKHQNIRKVIIQTKTTRAPKQGSVVSLTDMVSQFRRVLRTQSFKPRERVVNNMSEMMAAGIPDILSGFAISTNINMPLRRKSNVELHKYETNKAGAFLRGSAVNLRLGRFTAPVTAVYSFHGTVHISLPKGMRDFVRKDFVTASICIDGECRKNMAISSTSGMRSNSRIFSLNISGYLYLVAHRYVSLYIHNNSQRYDVTIVRGSYFSGMLVGT